MAVIGNRTLKLEGQRFGRLTALERLERGRGGYIWRCRCECGTERFVAATRLKMGKTRSCGCLSRDRSTIHGMTGSSLHNRWKAMLGRCQNPNDTGYRNYGQRGIFVCSEWGSFEAFAAWAGRTGYKPELQLDRIDNDGPYSPENCHWVTCAENCRNRRPNRRFSFFGEELIAKDAANKFGINVQTLLDRIDRGMEPEAAVTTERSATSWRRPGEYVYFGKHLTFAEAERRFGIKWQTIRWRIKSGQTPEDAVSRPARQRPAA